MIDFSKIKIHFASTPQDFWFQDGTEVSTSTTGPDAGFVARPAAQNGQPWADRTQGVFSFYFDPAAMGIGEGDEAYLKIAYDGVELDTALDAVSYMINNPATTPHRKISATLPAS